MFDLAIAVLETDNMETNYEYGDGKTCLLSRLISELFR